MVNPQDLEQETTGSEATTSKGKYIKNDDDNESVTSSIKSTKDNDSGDGNKTEVKKASPQILTLINASNGTVVVVEEFSEYKTAPSKTSKSPEDQTKTYDLISRGFLRDTFAEQGSGERYQSSIHWMNIGLVSLFFALQAVTIYFGFFNKKGNEEEGEL